MRPLSVVTVFSVFAAVLAACAPALAQGDSSEGSRKILLSVKPEYSALARQISVTGSVKLEAVVASDGTVKSISVKGGHPVLVEAAETAIRKWK